MATLASISGGKGRSTVNSHGLSAPTPEQYEKFMVWRALALEKMPYFSSLLFSLRVVNVPGFNTYAVDAHHRLYIGFDEVDKRGHQWNVESLLHECMHLLSAHSDMAKDVNVQAHERDAWNFAADCSINDDLVDAGCMSFATGEDPMPAQLGAENGKPGSHYFYILRRMLDEKRRNQTPQDQQQQQDAPEDGDQSGQNGSGMDPSQFKGCGSGSGGESAPFEMSEHEGLDGEFDGADGVERERVRMQTAQEIMEHKSRGTVPGGIEAIAKTILAPSPIPWQQILGGHLRRRVSHRRGMWDTSRAVTNRRRHNVRLGDLGRIIYPGTIEPVVKVEIIRDTSGSMSDIELAYVTREVESIAKKCGIRGNDLMVTDVDTKVYEPVAFHGAKSIADMKGRGGTDMTKGIRAATERDGRDRADVVVVMTDGETPWPTTPPPVPVIVAVVAPRVDGGSRKAAKYVADVPDFLTAVLVEVDRNVELTTVA